MADYSRERHGRAEGRDWNAEETREVLAENPAKNEYSMAGQIDALHKELEVLMDYMGQLQERISPLLSPVQDDDGGGMERGESVKSSLSPLIQEITQARARVRMMTVRANDLRERVQI